MIKVQGIAVLQRKTKKGSNLYVIVLPNAAMVKYITTKTLELHKQIEVQASSFVADKDLLLFE